MKNVGCLGRAISSAVMIEARQDDGQQGLPHVYL